jgi:molybdate transport system substrate-binding protein
MKRPFALLLALLTLCGCAAKPAPAAEEPTEVVVFAAASLLETLTEIGENYKSVAPGVTLTFSFDSSGTLKTQIEEGADCDLFLSAAPKQMNALQDAGLLDEASRVDLLENKVALVAAGDGKGVASFDVLAERLPSGDVLLAMGNGDVPVGQYTQKIFAYYGLDEAALAAAGALTYGSNVKEVTTQVAEGAADLGVVYATDARSAGLSVLDTATADMCGQVIYPAAVLKNSRHPDEAAAFLAYLQTPEAAAVFEAVGFTAPGK